MGDRVSYLNSAEFAERLGISYTTFTVWRSKGKPFRVPTETTTEGRRPLWAPEVADAFVAEVAAAPPRRHTGSGGRGRPRFTKT